MLLDLQKLWRIYKHSSELKIWILGWEFNLHTTLATDQNFMPLIKIIKGANKKLSASLIHNKVIQKLE